MNSPSSFLRRSLTLSLGVAALFLALTSAGLVPRALAAESRVTEFGSSESKGAALVGILYDLKQSQARTPMPMNIPNYGKLVDEFLASGWDESVLNRYFRAARPLYTTQVFIPLMSANAAPQAFGVDGIVKPMFWLVHYKGQVSAPTSGQWRFWGYGEEVCSVAVNGKNVLLSNWKEITAPSTKWKSPEGPGQTVASGALRAGDWIDLKAGQVIDLDVLIGERGGGVFCAFLLIEKRGETYAQQDGHPVLPIFQLAKFATPMPSFPKTGPKIMANGPVWNGTP